MDLSFVQAIFIPHLVFSSVCPQDLSLWRGRGESSDHAVPLYGQPAFCPPGLSAAVDKELRHPLLWALQIWVHHGDEAQTTAQGRAHLFSCFVLKWSAKVARIYLSIFHLINSRSCSCLIFHELISRCWKRPSLKQSLICHTDNANCDSKLWSGFIGKTQRGKGGGIIFKWFRWSPASIKGCYQSLWPRDRRTLVKILPPLISSTKVLKESLFF